jgi:structural maintenance of chromosome 4
VSNTLAAPDLETASRRAYVFNKRWRVVTLDRRLIKSSGTMADCARSVSKGAMRLKNTRSTAIKAVVDDDSGDNSKALEKQANKAMEEIRQCRQHRRVLAKQIQSLKKRVETLSVKLPKLAVKIEGFDTTHTTLTECIPELRSRCELSAEDEALLKELSREAENARWTWHPAPCIPPSWEPPWLVYERPFSMREVPS